MNAAQIKAITDRFEGCIAVVSVGSTIFSGTIEGLGLGGGSDGRDTDFLLLSDVGLPDVQTWVPAHLITKIAIGTETS